MRVTNLGPVFTQAAASGIHEVLVLSPEHDGGWADLDDKQAGLVMAALRDRFEEHARHSTVRYTQAIVNHGREAGASLEHPHGQLLGIPFVPGELAEELAGFVRFEGSCLLCTAHRGRGRAPATAWCTPTSGSWSSARSGAASPYEMLVIPLHARAPTSPRPRRVTSSPSAGRSATRWRSCADASATSPTTSCSTPPRTTTTRARSTGTCTCCPGSRASPASSRAPGVMINIVAPEHAAQELRERTRTLTLSGRA